MSFNSEILNWVLRRVQNEISPKGANSDPESDLVMIPKQLQDPAFRFVEFYPKGCEYGKDAENNQLISDGMIPQGNWQTNLLTFDSDPISRQLREHKTYGVATGHGGLIVVEAVSENGWYFFDRLPETFTVLSSNAKLLHLYLRILDDGMPVTQVRRVPLSDLEVEEYAHKLLEDGAKAFTSVRLEDHFSFKGHGVGVIGPNSRYPESAKYEIICDCPIATITLDELNNSLGRSGITDPYQKNLIYRRAAELSPEFQFYHTSWIMLKDLAPKPAPWDSELWHEISNMVSISNVYQHLGESIVPSSSARAKCLFCQGSESKQDVLCEDDRFWRCFNCQESGDAFELLDGVRGNFDKVGRTNWFKNSIEFAGFASEDTQKRWTDYLHTYLTNLVQDGGERFENPLLRALCSALIK